MTRDIAVQLSKGFEAAGWNHRIDVTSGDHAITLGVASIDGPGLLRLFSILAPNGVPLDVSASLSSGGLVVS